MRNYFTFGSIDSRDYGVYISGSGHFSVPSRAYEFEGIPGRTGDIVLGGRRIENFELTYPCFIAPVNGACGNYADYMSAFFALRNALLSVNGYADLKDSYTPGMYYRGVYVGGIKAESMSDLRSGEFEITFNCKPQRFYTAEPTITLTHQPDPPASIATDNKHGIPIITLTGTGTLVIYRWDNGVTYASETINVNQNFPNGMVIDSDLQEIYSVNTPAQSGNTYVDLMAYKFPMINPVGAGVAPQYYFSAIGVDGTVKIRWYDL